MIAIVPSAEGAAACPTADEVLRSDKPPEELKQALALAEKANGDGALPGDD